MLTRARSCVAGAARLALAAPRAVAAGGTAARRIASAHMLPVAASSAAAVEHYDAAVHQYLAFAGDPAAELAKAVEADPPFAMAHALNVAMHVLSGGCDAGYPPVAQSLGFLRSCTDGKAGGAALSPRERMHVVAAQELAAGEWRRATAAWEAATRAAPTDIVALRLLQDAYLFLGDLHNLRDSVARAFQAWDPTMPNYGRLCGLLAFGLEENNQWATAEELAMQALNMDPADAWALHAAVHVCEMNSRLDDGRRLLSETAEHWAPATMLNCHLHWHWTLFSIEDGEWRAALARYNEHIAAPDRSTPLDLIDATSFLWRMALQKRPAGPGASALQRTDVGATQWLPVCAAWQPMAGVHTSALVDLHVTMALAAAQQEDALAKHMRALEAAVERGRAATAAGVPPIGASAAPFCAIPAPRPASSSTPPPPPGGSDYAWTMAVAGRDMAAGIVAFSRGAYDDAVTALLRSRPMWQHVGGSNAQRDVFAQTLLHAALSAGQLDLARQLASERVTLRSNSPQAWWLLGSVLDALGDSRRATDARNRAYVLGLGQRSPLG